MIWGCHSAHTVFPVCVNFKVTPQSSKVQYMTAHKTLLWVTFWGFSTICCGHCKCFHYQNCVGATKRVHMGEKFSILTQNNMNGCVGTCFESFATKTKVKNILGDAWKGFDPKFVSFLSFPFNELFPQLQRACNEFFLTAPTFRKFQLIFFV